MENLCGECNVCCVAPKINKDDMYWRDEDKEVGEICEKLCDGQCSIYETRPTPCKVYECLWLQMSKKIENFPVEHRPDNLKIMVSTFNNPVLDKFIFTMKELEEGSFDLNNLVLGGFLDIIFKLSKEQITDGVVAVQPFGKDKAFALKQNSGG